MNISEKIKAINNKIKQNKAPYDLDRQTAKISASSSGNVRKYEFLTGKDVLPENDWLEKAAALKRFEYSPLGKELKAQTCVAEEQYQGLNKLFNPDQKEEPVTIKTEKSEIISESKLMYDNKYSFSEYENVRKFSDISFMSKYYKMLLFCHWLNEFRELMPRTEKTKNRKNNVYKNVAKLYDTLLAIYFTEYNNIIEEKMKRLIKIMVLLIHFLKVLNVINGTKYIKKKVNHSRKKLRLKE